MRALVIFILVLAPNLACAQQRSGVYAGVEGGYSIVQLHDEGGDDVNTFRAAKGSVFAGYRFASGWATEVSYLSSKEEIARNHAGFYNIQINVLDVALLYHSTTLLPGVFIRPAVGVATSDIEENIGQATAKRKEKSYLASFGLGYEYHANDHVSFRLMHTLYVARNGDKMNGLKLGMKFTY